MAIVAVPAGHAKSTLVFLRALSADTRTGRPVNVFLPSIELVATRLSSSMDRKDLLIQ